ncbi:hypothetical protein [Simkania sp.]|uniref:hypothetical protein n=1 Tax=Simkania sp. TaxID=34094 RepID=UPI003B52C61D
MKKRPFILLELFIALALVALFSLPLVHGQFFYAREQKKRLLEIEKELKAEECFYRVCEKLTAKHPLHKISGKSVNDPFSFDDNKISFDFGLLGKQTYYWHYHLYSNVAQEKDCRKLRIKICFLEKRNEKCETSAKFADAEYGFILTTRECRLETTLSKDASKK